MLFALRDYIAKEKRVSLKQLARAFKVDVAALEPMLAVWVQRREIVKEVIQNACKSSCLMCSQEAPIYYCYLTVK